MMGRCEVVIGGKSRRVSFGQNAWYIFCKLNGINISDIGKYFADVIHNPDSFRDIVFCGLKAADLTAGNDVEYNQYVVGDWLDEANDEVNAELLQTLIESRSQEKPGKKKGKASG